MPTTYLEFEKPLSDIDKRLDELRRLTTRWYTQKYGESTLWGEAAD